MESNLKRKKAELEIVRERIVDYIRYDLGFPLENSQTSVDEIELEMNKGICRQFPINDPSGKYTDEETAKVETFVAEYYKDLPKLIKEYRNKEAEILKLEQRLNFPDYILELIENGDLLPDGKTVSRSLNAVAASLSRKIVVTQYFLRKNFLNRKGKEYSKSALQQAVDCANSQK